MTASEAIKILKKDSCYECSQGTDSPLNCEYVECRVSKATRVAIKALEEVEQYRAIGTPEECRAAVEKQKEIKPKELKNIYPSGQYECPVCGYCVGKHKYFKSTPLGETLANCKMEFNYCPECGQKLDWSDEDENKI